jgi:trehalose synthase
MPRPVDLPPKDFQEYVAVAGREAIEEVCELGTRLRGLRVLMVSSTAGGGGVAVLLRSLVPALRSVGLQADWYTLDAKPAFFEVTKQLHNLLQGQAGELTDEQKTRFEQVNRINAAGLPTDDDIFVVHDPQPVAIRAYHPARAARWVWRWHIDTSEPAPSAWEYIHRYVRQYDGAVYTATQFAPPGLDVPITACIEPAIDPYHAINVDLPQAEIQRLVAGCGIALDRPLMGQFSRYDPWKDPVGVIRAYRLARERVPNLQLVLSGPTPEDDPEAQEVFQQTEQAASGDPEIHLLQEPDKRDVNALQRACHVVVQKSLREGFGLVVSEALWKHRPVVAANVGGIPLQMSGKLGELLVSDVESCADRVADLLNQSHTGIYMLPGAASAGFTVALV